MPRVREVLLWLVLLVGVLNFAPALFGVFNLAEEPLWRKIVKDLPVLVLIAWGLLRSRSQGPIVGDVDRRLRALRIAAVVLAGVMAVDAAVRRPDLLGLAVSGRYYVAYPLAAFAVWRLEYTSAEVGRFLKGICIVGALEGVVAALSTFNLFGETFYSRYVQVAGESFARAIGTLGNPDNLGVFLGLPALLLLWGRPFPARWLNWLLLAPVLIGIALSFSRTAGVALFGSITVVTLWRGSGRAALKIGLLLIPAATFLYLTFAARFGGRFSLETLLGSRTESITDGFELWSADPTTVLVGQGYGTVSSVEDGDITQTITDSMVVTFALEGGLIALVAFAAIVWPAVRIVLLAERAARSRLTLAIAAYGLFFLLYTPISVNFRLFPAAMLMWILVGLAATLAHVTSVVPYEDEASASSLASSSSIAPAETATERVLFPAPP